ncbi:MAG: ROK family protein [Propionibacteriaceae bacterium]|jgi:predicted NBD/HSP70 family sugar kinase|nr:ROK family protein [Propionibacteriaceae bacterium]
MRTAAEIHRLNAFDVVRSIHAAGVCTRRELVEATSLSFSTVSTICAKLIEAGVVVEAGRDRPIVGRPTARLTLNPEHGHFLGVDIAETYVHVETLNAALETMSSTRWDIDPHKKTPAEVIQRVQAAIAVEHARHLTTPLLGVGVAAPGQVDQAGGASIFAPNWGWHNVPLVEQLADGLGAPLYLDNPLKSLVVSEIWSNPERHHEDFTVINLGTGVGAAFAIEGRIHRGHTNSAGEWGHTVLVGDGRACRCGSRGCVEAYVGAVGILRTLRETHPTSDLLCGDDQTATLAALGAAADKGDPAALDVIEQTSRFLGMAIASIINFLNPSLILITGWVASHIGQRLVDQAQPHIKAHALAVPLMGTTVELQHMKSNAVCLGAAAQAFEGYLDALSSEPFDQELPPARRS